MKNKENRVLGWLFVGAAVLLEFVIYPRQIRIDGNEIINSAFMPRICAVMFLLLGFGFLWDGYGRGAYDGEGKMPEAKIGFDGWLKTQWKLFAVIVVFVAYILLFPVLGYLTSTFAVLCYLFWRAHERNLIKIILISSGASGVIYLIFKVIMKVSLPAGFLI